MNENKLFLIPTSLTADNENNIPSYVKEIIVKLNFFIVEEIKTARRFLKKINKKINIDELHFFVLNEHTKIDEIYNEILPILLNNQVGLLSEAGTPCIADPGSDIVKVAHENNIKVVPLSGPSSIILGLMASGFNGQSFAFNGYLPVDKIQCCKAIKNFENLIYKNNQTQIFIETPYRNNKLLNNFINSCNNNTQLCIASNLTAENELIISQSIFKWKSNKNDFNKIPAVFLLYK